MKHKRLIAALLTAFMVVSATGCIQSHEIYEEVNTETENSEESVAIETESIADSTGSSEIPDAYMSILEDVYDAVIQSNEEEFIDTSDVHYGLTEELYAVGYDYAIDNICYALEDIDGNGVKELLIVDKVSADPNLYDVTYAFTAGYSILEIYTLDGDNAVNLFTSWIKNQIFINSDGLLINTNSNGDETFGYMVSVLEISSNGVAFDTLRQIYPELDSDGQTVVFHDTDSDIDPVPYTDDAGWEYINGIEAEYLTDFLEIDMVPVASVIE